MNASLRRSGSRLPWRLASDRRATHCVAVAKPRALSGQARADRQRAREEASCLSRADADGPRAATRRGRGRSGSDGFEEAEQVAGDVALQAALEAALDLARGLALGGAPGGGRRSASGSA